MAKRQSRKLTTIFCADVSGFGRHMARDEDRALQRLQDYRALMQAKFDEFNGRLVNTWGDAVIAEFSSVVEALRCAVDIQDSIASHNALTEGDGEMSFRIGINLGDVMVDGDDLYGDGVNMAARLEAAATPGEILVSRSVYELSHKQLAIGFDYAGEQEAKSGEESFEAYQVRIGGSNEAPNLEKPKETPVQPPEEGSSLNIFDWFKAQPKTVQTASMLICFFFATNAFFTGLATPWFIFPSLPMALIILMRRKKTDN